MSAILTLQNNASEFFTKFSTKYADQMSCKKSCADCCYTDIGVFEVEAELITNWFNALDPSDRINLKTLWSTPTEKKACSFLYNNICTIYPVRPLICRTQGVAIYLPLEEKIDFCPLNFKEKKPEFSDTLNLERLNTLLSLAAKSESKDQRIRLKKLKLNILKDNE
jgi:Fe-S-cluster containining protein